MIKKLLCKLGWHDWVCYHETHLRTRSHRQCLECYKIQKLEFFSNGAQGWVTIKDPKQIK